MSFKSIDIIQIKLPSELGLHVGVKEEMIAYVLTNFLRLYNRRSQKEYKNITLSKLIIEENCIPFAIILFNTKDKKEGYRRVSKPFNLQLTPYSYENRIKKLIGLIEKENLSVRNIQKHMSLTQKQSRLLYGFLKEKGIFEISPYNNMQKTYFIEKIQTIKKSEIITYFGEYK